MNARLIRRATDISLAIQLLFCRWAQGTFSLGSGVVRRLSWNDLRATMLSSRQRIPPRFVWQRILRSFRRWTSFSNRALN
jgi:hypothetical protein